MQRTLVVPEVLVSKAALNYSLADSTAQNTCLRFTSVITINARQCSAKRDERTPECDDTMDAVFQHVSHNAQRVGKTQFSLLFANTVRFYFAGCG